MATNEYLLSLSITIMSIIITITTTVIAIYLIKQFMKQTSLKCGHQQRSHSHTDNENVKTKRYFKISASITLIFNAFNAFFNTVYCIYLLFDPHHDDNVFYIYHPSHIQRIMSTVSWYIAKVSLVWFFTGRLYHGFKGTILRINQKTMLSINIFNTMIAPVSLFVAYWSVYKQYLVAAELGFNLLRVEYQIVVFIILVLFSKRLLLLAVQEQSMAIMESVIITNTDSSKELTNIDNIHMNAKEHRMEFVIITTRNAILVLTICFSVGLVTFSFCGFRWIFGKQTRLSLLIPMNMASFDSLITSVCMICLFQIGDNLYYFLCNICDKKIYKLFIFMAKAKMRNALIFRNTQSKNKVNSEMELQFPGTHEDVIDTKPQKKLSLKQTVSNSDPKSNKRKTKEFSESLMDNVKLPVLQLRKSNSAPI